MESFFADPNVYDDRGLRLGPYSFLKEGPEQTLYKHLNRIFPKHERVIDEKKAFEKGSIMFTFSVESACTGYVFRF